MKQQLEGMGYFLKEVLPILCKDHPQHQFYFLFDREFDKEYLFADNVHALVVPPPARHPLLWRFWYDVKVPLALKKIKADVFVSLDGFCSLTTKVPQCLLVHDLGFLHQPTAYQKSHLRYYKNNTPKFVKKAATLATVSQFSKNDMVAQYHVLPQKINVVYNAAKDCFRPQSFDVQNTTREKYTQGKNYFLYVGAIQPRKNLVHLLKAFSIFKKRLKTEMLLVLAGRLAWKNEEFLKLLSTYKYKDDVVLTGYMPEADLAHVMAAAYALVYPSLFEGFGVPVLEAMQAHIPVLTSANTSMQEVAGEAALYFNPADTADIADKLMRIYKDESLRTELIQKGRQQVQNFTWQQTANLLWQSIEAAAKEGKRHS